MHQHPLRITALIGCATTRSQKLIFRPAVSILLGLGLCAPASAHCIVGNRFKWRLHCIPVCIYQRRCIRCYPRKYPKRHSGAGAHASRCLRYARVLGAGQLLFSGSNVVPGSLSQSSLLISRKPWPLHAFSPLQLFSAELHALWPWLAQPVLRPQRVAIPPLLSCASQLHREAGKKSKPRSELRSKNTDTAAIVKRVSVIKEVDDIEAQSEGLEIGR